jgi:RNA polymerase sigma-70 factor (ECF subfamily)
MPVTHASSASPTPDGVGFRALLELVLDALGARPAFAMTTGGRHAITADVPVDARPDPAEPTPEEPAGTPQPQQQPRGPRHAVDDTHVEIWQLVTRAQQKDGDAFGQLYDRYYDVVFRYIYYRVNDKATAEDFTSETFLRALRRIGGITYQGRDIGAWFITIARNIVLDHVKSARHRLEVTTAEPIERSDNEPGPEAAVITSMTSQQLMRAVHKLGDDQRDCVILRFIQGMSVSETAEIMGKNDGAIKALQHRAIRKLADLVRGELR